jgi:hypothetical protein
MKCENAMIKCEEVFVAKAWDDNKVWSDYA